jgi:hypothetical protein
MMVKVNNPNESTDYEASHFHNFLHPPFLQIHMISPRRFMYDSRFKGPEMFNEICDRMTNCNITPHSRVKLMYPVFLYRNLAVKRG